MIPYDLDPSLYSAEPETPSLDDGFSPSGLDSTLDDRRTPASHLQVDPALWAKSQF